MAQVVAAGVLDQPAVEIQQFTRAGDHFHPCNPLARIAIADHADAAGIGGDVAADGTGTTRCEIYRILQSMVTRSVVHCFQRHAGLHGQ